MIASRSDQGNRVNSMSENGGGKRQLRFSPWHSWKWLLYVLITLLAVGLEMGTDLLQAAGISDLSDKTIYASELYQRFATAGYRKPRSHFVKIVLMSPVVEPPEIFANFCKKREFEAALLEKLKQFSPSVVVLDFWYSAQSCTGDDAERQERLAQTISDLSARVPVVVGLESHTLRELERDRDTRLPELKARGFGPRDQVLDDRTEFRGANLNYASIRLDTDTRRIPISWFIYASKPAMLSGAGPESVPSLAYLAAVKHDDRLRDVFGQTSPSDPHPFTSFIPESQFQPVNATEVLCDRPVQKDEDWRKCKPPNLDHDVRLAQLEGGKIILVAENSQMDQHRSVFGESPGYILQANYIESLLDDRYLRPIRPFLELVFAILGVITVVVVFHKWPNPFLGVTVACLFVIGIAAVCNLVGLYGGWFVGFWIPMVPIPFLELAFNLRKTVAP